MHAWLSRILVTALLAGPAVAALAQEIASGAADQSAVALTLYQSDLALVRDERTVDLQPGPARLALHGISALMLPETATVSGDASLKVLQQRHAGATLSRQNLLEAYVGRRVGLLREHPQTGAPIREEGVLLSAAGGQAIVRIGERVEFLDSRSPWRLALEGVTDELRPWPTLVLDLDNQTRGPQSLELLYLTRGLAWQADYTGRLSADGSRLELTGWANLQNNTGTDFRNARVQLVAGDVNQAGPRFQPLLMKAERARADLARAAVGEYHVYSIAEPVDLPDQQRLQVPLLGKRDVPVRREYLLQGDALMHLPQPQRQPVAVQLLLDNTVPELGEPLPAGVVRVLQQGPEGQVLFAGEDRIEHTPVGGELKLRLGSAFDLSASRTQMAYRQLGDNRVEVSWRIQLFNSKNVPVTIHVEENLMGEWRIVSSNTPHQRVDAHTVRWPVEVPAGGGADLEYKAEIRP